MIAEKTSEDTVSLLKECCAGTKTAVKSLDEVLDVVKNGELKKLLEGSKSEHEKIGLEIDRLLIEYKQQEKEPSPMAKAMSWTKINVKIMADKTDNTVADIMTEGCGMGIKTLCRYKNEYKAADRRVADIADRLIKAEDELVLKLRKYL